MIFETATDDDVPQIRELMQISYRGDETGTGWTNEWHIMSGNRTSEELLREEMSSPGGSYLKYTNESGEIIGCVYIQVVPQDKKVLVGSLCVHPTFQSRGIGKKLLAASEDIGRQAGCSKLCVKVITVRKELIAWYEKMGYRSVGDVIPFVGGTGIPKIPLELGTWEKRLE